MEVDCYFFQLTPDFRIEEMRGVYELETKCFLDEEQNKGRQNGNSKEFLFFSLYTLTRHCLPLSLFGPHQRVIKVFEFPCSSWHSYGNSQQVFIKFENVAFLCRNVVLNSCQARGRDGCQHLKKKEIFHLLCVDIQSYKHITGG